MSEPAIAITSETRRSVLMLAIEGRLQGDGPQVAGARYSTVQLDLSSPSYVNRGDSAAGQLVISKALPVESTTLKAEAMGEEILCRNCQSANVIVSGNGIFAPFFILRVLGRQRIHTESLYEAIHRKASHPQPTLKRGAAQMLILLAKTVPKIRQVLNYRSDVQVTLKTQIRICKDCGFVGANQSYSSEQLLGLYYDYRSETYNQDRCSVEPSYALIKDHVGKSPQEQTSRMNHMDKIIETFIAVDEIHSVLDWGGGEGRFVPSKLRNRSVTILDFSNEQPTNKSFHRVDKLDQGQTFDYLQICHVLEHVSEPHKLMSEVVSHVKKGGYIYIEVPQDRSDSDLEQFISSPEEACHYLHEHINLYNAKSLTRLGASLGLKQLDVSVAELDFGWIQGSVVSGLFIKEH